ncbi:hypothetical protein [Pseudomonas entomophila]|uniref:hypothetical protein n=1 Tax=Pseudomonas entomophila TaxID=312306 RepID=UPI0015E37F91|nr:hypothetical protein [Pseudomonas entomophila]
MKGMTHTGSAGWLSRILAGAVLVVLTSVAGASEVTLTAQYRGGGTGQFENTTPPAQNCRLFGSLCIKGQTVDIPLTYGKQVTKATGNVRDQLYVQTPRRREVDVYDQDTGDPHRLSFEISGLMLDVISNDYSHNPLTNGMPNGGCTLLGGIGYQSQRRAIRGLRITSVASPSGCWQVNVFAPNTHVEPVQVSRIAIAYNLAMPPTYRMKPGLYRGTTIFTVGPGGDFDFGDQVHDLSDNTLTIHFELEVEHAFIFDFPPGSERAVLEPVGGWKAWLNGGRVPQRLYRDLPMRVWSTGPLKVYKLCEYDVGLDCGIRNDLGEDVPVRVSLSLPSGIRYQGGPVTRLTLPTGRAAALRFDSVIPTINRPGELHFEVTQADVQPMLGRAGKTYKGKATVVFDAEL